MTPLIEIERLPPLDDPWGRIAWLLPAAIITWAVLLFVFARLLEQSAPPAPELKPIEARIVEVPIGGLQGGGGGPSSIPAVKAQPKPIAKPVPRPVVQRPKKIMAPPASAEGSLPNKSAEAPSSSGGGSATSSGSGESSSGGGSESGATGEGTGGGVGPGSDSTGARAIYAPAPVIPDDMREDAIQTEAVAHFKVSADGNVDVALATPTPNPRLNQLLLDTLRQWRFFPATKSGIAIDAAFDIRIPITVQ